MEHILIAQFSPISQDSNGIVEFLKAIAPVLGGAIGAILGSVATQFVVFKQRRIRAIAERINNMELAYSKLLARMTSFKAAHDNYRVSIGKIIINNQLPKTYRDKEGGINPLGLEALRSLRLDAVLDYTTARGDYFRVVDGILETTGQIKAYATYLEEKQSLELQNLVDKLDKLISECNERLLLIPDKEVSEEEFRGWLREKEIKDKTFLDKELGPVYVDIINTLAGEMMNDRERMEKMEENFWKFWLK